MYAYNVYTGQVYIAQHPHDPFGDYIISSYTDETQH